MFEAAGVIVSECREPMACRTEQLVNLKCVIRALLMVNNAPTRYDSFVREYRRREGHYVPYQKYGYPDCLSFLRSLTDTVYVKEQDGGVVLLPNLDGSLGDPVRHVQELISAQKVETPRHNRDVQKRTPPRKKIEPELPGTVQRNLQTLVSKFADGVDVRILQDAYVTEFGVSLNAQQYGFDSLQECLSKLKFLKLSNGTHGTVRVCLHSSNGWTKESLRQWSTAPLAPSSEISPPGGVTAGDSMRERFNTLRDNIQRVLERYPDGIFMSRFAQTYADEIGEALTVGTMQLIQRWPELFHITRPNSSGDFIVFPADYVDTSSSSPSEGCAPSSEGDVKLEYTSVKLPEVASESYFPVRVSHIFSPGRFSIQPVALGDQNPLSALMRAMADLYNSHAGDRYTVKVGRVQVGQVCAVAYSLDGSPLWYRAIITGVCNLHTLEVELVDFGNHCMVHCTELRHLPKEFLELPVQCAKAALALLCPKAANNGEWSESAYKRFRNLSADKILMCRVENRSGDLLLVTLCDTHGSRECFINDILIDEGLAEGEVTQLTPPAVGIRLIRLSTGASFHVVTIESRDYISSKELSLLLGWSGDCIVEELQKKGIAFTSLLVTSDKHPQLIEMMECTTSRSTTVCLFPADNIVDAVNLFKYPHTEINSEIRQLLLERGSSEMEQAASPVRKKNGKAQLTLLQNEYDTLVDERRHLYLNFSMQEHDLERVDRLQSIEARMESLKKEIDKFSRASS